MNAPGIKTAIPKRRYQFGEYEIVVLGEVESSDDVNYQYIMALVREGSAKPYVYVTSERNPRKLSAEGSHRMRVRAQGFDKDLGSSDRWKDVDAFATDAAKVIAELLQLTDEQLTPLM